MPTLSVTTVIDRPAHEVWGLLRDFRDPSAWYPVPLADHAAAAGSAARPVGGLAVGGSADTPDTPGGGGGDASAAREPAVRHVRAPGGALIRERLVEHDDSECSYTYEVLDLDRQPCGLRLGGPCLATLRVESIIGGTMARVVWSVRYDDAAADDGVSDGTTSVGTASEGTRPEGTTSDGAAQRERIRHVERDLFRPALRELRQKLS